MFDYYLAPYVAKSYVRNVLLYLSATDPLVDYDPLKPLVIPPLDDYIKKHQHILTYDGHEQIAYIYKSMHVQYTDECKKWALKKTEQDTYQAMEAFIHNLCTLQCLPGSSKIWVLDVANMSYQEILDVKLVDRYMHDTLADVRHLKSLSLMSMEDIYNAHNSEYGRYVYLDHDARTVNVMHYEEAHEYYAKYEDKVRQDPTYPRTHLEPTVCRYWVLNLPYDNLWNDEEQKIIERDGIPLDLVPIEGVYRNSNHRRLVKLTTETGRTCITTDNHRWLVLHQGTDRYGDKYEQIEYQFPEQASMVLIGNSIKCVKNSDGLYQVQENDIVPLATEFIPKDEHYEQDIKLDVSVEKIVKREILDSGEEYVYDLSIFHELYIPDGSDNCCNFLTEDMLIVHNSRSGGQTPFSSVNFGTDTSEEGRMVIDKFLDAAYEGLGNHETPIFPISIFKMMKGKNRKGDPNYDLFQKACKVSAYRLLPNFLNVDASFNRKYYVEGHPETEVATMGMTTDGDVTVKYKNKEPVTIDIKDLGEYITNVSGRTPIHLKGCPGDSIIDDLKGFYIKDSFSHGWTELQAWMSSKDCHQKWYKVTFAIGTVLTLTGDHPLAVKVYDKTNFDRFKIVRTLVQDLHVHDEVLTTALGYSQHSECPHNVVTTVTGIEAVYEPNMVGYDVRTVSDHYDLKNIVSFNCRTRVVANVYDSKNQIIPGRGNLYPLIVNLPYIALEAKREYDQLQTHDTDFEEYFIGKLDRYQDECFDLLIDKLNYISKKKAKNFPFLMGNHLYVGSEHFTPESEIGPAIRNGTLTIGVIGLAECLVVLTGKHHGESDAAQELGLSIIKHMYDRCVAKSEEMQLNFTLMGAPAEGAAGRLLRCTRKEFGIIPGVTDHEFLTNSHHIPVYYKISFVDKVLKEAPYHKYEPAG